MPNNPRVSHHPNEGCESSARKPTLDTKRLGEVAELAFILKATSLSLTPSRPYGDRRPYDFLLECGKHALRIQVKSVFNNRPRDGHRFSVNVGQHRGRGRAAYTSEDIDFVVAYVAPQNAWYVIPVDALSGRTFINLYPLGKRRSDGGLFEKYREAWHLLLPKTNCIKK
jgi:hypothetical protein